MDLSSGEIGDGSDFGRRSGNGLTTELLSSARTNLETGPQIPKTPPIGRGLNWPK